MPDDNTPSNTSSTAPRPKPPRSNTTGTVRGRTSPPPGSSAEQNGDGRPPTKRARKAINCEPCRNSKLKCDRNRPCSSCVLRGTSAMCYQDQAGHENGPNVRGDEHHYSRIDPAQEIARLRHSITLLEAHIFPHSRNSTLVPRRPSDASALIPKKEAIDPDVCDKDGIDSGMSSGQVQGGLFTGPTSAASYFSKADGRGSDEAGSRQHSQDRADDPSNNTTEYDRDLLVMLPSVGIIDALITYYFEYCNWIYRHINQPALIHNWERFKAGTSADRLTLATVCAIMALAVHYLPSRHHILESFSENHEIVGQKYYDISTTALQRRLAESRAYSLELVELLLIRSGYQTLHKTDAEEIWHITGELITIGTAMGLHRDPGKWRLPRDLAERRRWAWWHIILLERWQAFLFGRPISIASHHFDTQLPSYCDPVTDKTGRLYLPNIALFRLAFILGDVMDDAVSVRPVPYESVMANDRALTQWMDNLPPELDLDEYRVARNLASPNPALRRLGVQSVIIRTSYHHIRFTLHRHYAISNANSSAGTHSKVPNLDSSKTAQSLEIAVGAADKLITMIDQSSLAVPGHMSWAPFHTFSAAMFFSFQLIANPDQPGAGLFRANIRKAIATLEQARGTPVGEKAYDILQALAPLYSAEFPLESKENREKQQAHVLGIVRKLAFPYHDSSHDPRRYTESPNGRGLSSPTNSNSLSPPMSAMPSLPPYEPSAVRTTTNGPHQMIYPESHIHVSQSPHAGAQLSPTASLAPTPAGFSQQYNLPQTGYGDTRYAQYLSVDDMTMWGASVGFNHGEWAQFLDGLRPDVSTNGRHLPIT